MRETLLFLHVPKTAGTTFIEQCVAVAYFDPARNDEDRLVDGVYYYPAGFAREEWESVQPPGCVVDELPNPAIRAVAGHFYYGLHEYVPRPCAYVTILREPVDRLVSLYRHMVRHEALDLSLEQFVQNPPLREADNGQTRRIAGQQPALGECNGSLLETALDNLEHIAVVGTSSYFDETLWLTAERFNWQRPPQAYFPRNVDLNKERAIPASEAIAERIRERNKWDVALFDAARRRMEKALAAGGAEFRARIARFREAQARRFAGLDEQTGRTLELTIPQHENDSRSSGL